MHRSRGLVALGLVTSMGVACGDDEVTAPPTEVGLGETTAVVLVNPTINTGSSVTLPTTGTARSGLDVTWGGETQVRTDADGVAVLGGIAAGSRSLSVIGSGLSGTVNAAIAEKDLHEIAVALTPAGAAVMANLRYAFGGEVVDITPSTPLAQVNQHLSRSNIIVLMSGGLYRGDLRFTGSNVTLFGAGLRGGEVTIEGDITIIGSSNRIRGARIQGLLTISGSNAGLSFSRVTGAVSISGSGVVLLNNAFCGQASLSGSNATLLGNAGLAPIGAPSSC